MLRRCCGTRGSEFVLSIAGDGILSGRLQHLAQELELGDRVRFLGRLPEEELRDLYAAADLFVLPTIAYEGFGMATIEALASGVPVVGTAVGATPELLAPLDPRLVIATADPEELYSAIASTLDRTNDAFRRQCAAYARSRYEWGHVIMGWEAALCALLPERSPASVHETRRAEAINMLLERAGGRIRDNALLRASALPKWAISRVVSPMWRRALSISVTVIMCRISPKYSGRPVSL